MTRLAVGVALIATVLLVPRLGHRQIVGSHEAVFPLVARDIVERGAWTDAHLRGVPYRNKPPLYPWAIAALCLVIGVFPGPFLERMKPEVDAIAAIYQREPARTQTAMIEATLVQPENR